MQYTAKLVYIVFFVYSCLCFVVSVCSCIFIVILGLLCTVASGGVVFIYDAEAAVRLYVQSSLLFSLFKYSSLQ